LLAGCGVGGDKAPLNAARHINTITSNISTACGELDQLMAFPPPPAKDVNTLKATASSAVRQLAAVYRAHPSWVFDGVTVGTIVNQARAMLRGCGLKEAAEQLKRQTAHR
jgi:hypothetical protein